MLEYLHIKNFRSHRDTLLRFAPGVNAIIGWPQSGKTNILRALDWVATGRPLGFRFHSNFAGSDPTEVSVKATGTPLIKVVRDEKTTKYFCGDDMTEGTAVPDEVKRLLNLDAINTQEQLEGPFLILSSPGEIARVINRVTRLEKVADWVASFTRRITAEKKNLEYLSGKILGLEGEISSCDGVLDGLEDMVAEYEGVDMALGAASERLLSLEAIRGRLITINEELDSEEEYLKYLEDIYNQALELSRKLQLRGLLSEYQEVSEAILANEEWLKDAAPMLQQAVKQKKEVDTMQEKIKALEEFNQALSSIDASVAEMEEDRSRILSSYSDALKKHGKCPTCFSVVDRDMFDRIMDNL